MAILSRTFLCSYLFSSIMVIERATMDKHPLNCKKFDSYTSPCTKRDNEALKELRRLINVGGTYPGDIFYKAKAVCMNCKSFEPEFF